MCREIAFPEGYGNVTVLLFKWRTGEDQFTTTEQEVDLQRSILRPSPSSSAICPLVVVNGVWRFSYEVVGSYRCTY